MTLMQRSLVWIRVWELSCVYAVIWNMRLKPLKAFIDFSIGLFYRLFVIHTTTSMKNAYTQRLWLCWSIPSINNGTRRVFVMCVINYCRAVHMCMYVWNTNKNRNREKKTVQYHFVVLFVCAFHNQIELLKLF